MRQFNCYDINYATADLLHDSRANLPLASDMKSAFLNYNVLMQSSTRYSHADPEFIAIMNMLMDIVE